MAIGPIAPPAAGFNAANRFVYDNLVMLSRSLHPALGDELKQDDDDGTVHRERKV